MAGVIMPSPKNNAAAKTPSAVTIHFNFRILCCQIADQGQQCHRSAFTVIIRTKNDRYIFERYQQHDGPEHH